MAQTNDDATFFKFIPNGQVYETTDRFMLPELVWIQKHVGLDLSEMGPGTQTMLGMFLVVRRSDPQRWGIKAFENTSTEDFENYEPPVEQGLPEAEDEAPDPTAESVPVDESATSTD